MQKSRVIRHEVVQPPDQSIRLIPLTRNQTVIVDASDYEWLTQWPWYAFHSRGKFYAARFRRVSEPDKPIMILMHRELTNYEGEETDHRDRDTLNNRRKNLRPCSRSQNQWNRGSQQLNTSGYKGVSWSKQNKKWQAQTSQNGTKIHLGHYPTKEMAYAAYCDFVNKQRPEFGTV